MSRKKRTRAHTEQPQVIDPSNPAPLFPFYGLGDDVFEECCCHIFFHEPEVKNTDLHNRPRQKQYGADAIADRRDSSGIDAVSCKHYKSIRKGQIETFVNEFLDYWDSYWSTRRVRRFVLCVACDLR